MQGIREYNKKITSLRNTRKITSSMKMISSIKLQRYAKLRLTAAPFWETARSMLARVDSVVGENHILLDGYPETGTSLIVLFSSDRGLCGRFNSNAIRKALQLSESLASRERQCVFSFAGLKGHAFFKRGKLPIDKIYAGVPDYSTTTRIADDLFSKYTRGDIQEVWLVYAIKTGLTEEPCIERLLPLGTKKDRDFPNDLILLEESSSVLLENYAQVLVKAKIYKALLESAVSEHSARMSAMDTATSNCDQMIQNYVKLRNRARQTAITTELSEIVSGKEAIDN